MICRNPETRIFGNLLNICTVGPMRSKYILLVEGNPADELLTVSAVKKSRLIDNIKAVRDGAEALDLLFCRGQYENRSGVRTSQK